MSKAVVGVNLPGGTNFDNLESTLDRIINDGFKAVEINLSSFPMIIGGKTKHNVVDFVKNILDKYELIYTAHICYGLDLRNLDEAEMHRDVLYSSIDVCSMLGIRLLNVHFEERTVHKPKEEAFYKTITDAADYALKKNVLITIENVEVEFVHHVTNFVRQINHPNIKMNLDLGHLMLSSVYFGYDYLESVRDCADILGHVHINDNTGDFEPMRITEYHVYNTLNMNYRMTFGRGDIHIPPLWGKTPIKAALEIIAQAGYTGIWMCEYNSQLFKPFNKDICRGVFDIVSAL